MAGETKKVRKFRITKGMEQLEALTHELMIRRVVYEIKLVMVKGVVYLEIITRDELTDTARKEIVKEAEKALKK